MIYQTYFKRSICWPSLLPEFKVFFLCNLILVFYRLIDLASQLLLLFLMWLLLLLLLPHLRSLSLSLMHPHTHTLSLSMRITACKIAVIFFFGANLQKVPVIFFFGANFLKTSLLKPQEWKCEWVCELFRSRWYSLSLSLSLSFFCSLLLSLSLFRSLSLSLSCSASFGDYNTAPLFCFLHACFFSVIPIYAKKGVMK